MQFVDRSPGNGIPLGRPLVGTHLEIDRTDEENAGDCTGILWIGEGFRKGNGNRGLSVQQGLQQGTKIDLYRVGFWRLEIPSSLLL